MKHKINRFLTIIKNASRKQIIIATLVVLAMGYFFIFRGSSTPEGVVRVERGSVSQEVAITGNTKPLETVNLAFEQTGKIAAANVIVGSRVFAGQILASLDQGQLLAQRAEQSASVDSENARLAEMQKGSRPEDVQIKQAALAKANQDLNNAYQGISDVLNDAEIKADDAIRKQLDSLFDNDEATNARLTFQTNSSQLRSNIENNRLIASSYLNEWKKEVANLSTVSSKTTLDQALDRASTKLSFFRDFLADLMTALNTSPSLSDTQIDTYKTNINTARTNINTALTSVNNTVQSISAEKLVVKQSEADLNKTLAGNTPESIASQLAQVKQAEARVQATNAQLQKMVLRAPFSGIVTKQDAKVGEIASPNTPVISLISEGRLEIEANVPEVDIGKVMVGNPVSITIDAFPGETFAGKVRYIDPAETIVDGVTNFKIKVDINQPDPRLKSGLTSNLIIKTLEKNNVLVLPQYALSETSEGVFVEQKQGDKTVKIPVTVGIRGHDGKVEILSGVKEGDMVVSGAAKTTP